MKRFSHFENFIAGLTTFEFMVFWLGCVFAVFVLSRVVFAMYGL